MGYKIEIVLISIAIFLCGVIVLFNTLKPETPVKITANKTSIVETESANKRETVKQIVSNNIKTDNQSYKININTASKDDLMQLDGIGDVISQRIIDYRKNNKFDSIEEIVEVSGIGEKKFEDIKRYITVE